VLKRTVGGATGDAVPVAVRDLRLDRSVLQPRPPAQRVSRPRVQLMSCVARPTPRSDGLLSRPPGQGSRTSQPTITFAVGAAVRFSWIAPYCGMGTAFLSATLPLLFCNVASTKLDPLSCMPVTIAEV